MLASCYVGITVKCSVFDEFESWRVALETKHFEVLWRHEVFLHVYQAVTGLVLPYRHDAISSKHRVQP